MGRKAITAWRVPVAAAGRVNEFYEAAANIMHPCRVIGVAIDSQEFSDEEAAAERDRVPD